MSVIQPYLTLAGMYDYNPNLFSEWELPNDIDSQIVIDNLMIESTDLGCWLPDPVKLQHAIGSWSKSKVDVWEHLLETTQYEYNPIWNKDGTILETETRNLTATLDNTVDGSVAAFNSSTLQPASQQVTDGTSTDTGTVSKARTEQGNIGITSTQQLINEEREVAQFNIYEVIVRDFMDKFLIMVY